MKKILLVCASALAISSVNAQTLFSEDFEAYTEFDNAAMVTGQWDGNNYPATSGPSDDIAAHGGTQSFKITSGNIGFAHAQLSSALTPSTSNQLRATYWWFPTNRGIASREGLLLVASGGLYTNAKTHQIAFGGYSTNHNNFFHRAVGTGADSVWTASALLKPVTATWQKMVVEVGTTSNANKVRFFVDDVLAGDRPINAGAYTALKIGSNAGDATSATGTTYIDDLSVASVTGVPVSMSGFYIE